MLPTFLHFSATSLYVETTRGVQVQEKNEKCCKIWMPDNKISSATKRQDVKFAEIASRMKRCDCNIAAGNVFLPKLIQAVCQFLRLSKSIAALFANMIYWLILIAFYLIFFFSPICMLFIIHTLQNIEYQRQILLVFVIVKKKIRAGMSTTLD